MCNLDLISPTTSPSGSTHSIANSSMHSPKQNPSIDEQHQQDLNPDNDETKVGPRTNTPSSLAGTRSDVDSPVRSYAVIETDPTELDRIIDVLRQFFPNTRIVECNNQSSNPSRTPSRSSLVAAPQQQTSIESNSSLRVPTLGSNRYRSHSHSISDKSSFESDILQTSSNVPIEAINISSNDSTASASNPNSQAFKGKVKDYLQRRYLEQISEHQTRKETFLKCRSDDLNYGSLKWQPFAGHVQSFEHITPSHHDRSLLSPSSALSSIHKGDRPIKACSFDSASALQHSVSDTNLCCALSASEANFAPTQSPQIIRSQSKRGLLQRCATIDMEDTPASNINDEQMTSPSASPTSPITDEKIDPNKITFSIDRPDDEDDHSPHNPHDHQTHPEKKSSLNPTNLQAERRPRLFRHSHSDQPTTDSFLKTNNNFLVPFRHSFEQQHDTRSLTVGLPTTPVFQTGIPIPMTPYSASSDPGPYQSPWSHTPASPYSLGNFRFPKSQEHLVASAQGSIAQLSSLTKILCNEPSVFTPITPSETQEANSSRTSSNVPPCQICRQQFDSRQMYLAHYRTHLDNSCEDDKSGILEFATVDNHCDRPGELRNYSCKICSKRFSRSDMLNRHLRLHSGIRPYRCTMCNTHFSRSDHLSTHLRTHTGEKPYTCPECSYAACRRDMITRHLKVHSKQRSERKNATSSLGSSNES